MTEISFRSQPAGQIIPAMVGRRLDGATADLTETTLSNLFRIATRRGCVQQADPPFRIYSLGGDQFDATFELREH